MHMSSLGNNVLDISAPSRCITINVYHQLSRERQAKIRKLGCPQLIRLSMFLGLFAMARISFGQNGSAGVQDFATDILGVDLATSDVHLSIPLRNKPAGHFYSTFENDSQIYGAWNPTTETYNISVTTFSSPSASILGPVGVPVSTYPGGAECNGHAAAGSAWSGVVDETGALHRWTGASTLLPM